MDTQTLLKVFASLRSIDKASREDAENFLEQMDRESPAALLRALLEFALQAPQGFDQKEQETAMILFMTYVSRYVDTDEYRKPTWQRIGPEDRLAFKQKALELCGKMMENTLELVEAIGQAEIDLQKEGDKERGVDIASPEYTVTIFSVWPEARQTIGGMINSGNATLHANALEMFGLAPFSFMSLSEWSTIYQLLANGVNPKHNLDVRMAAVDAMSRLFEDMRVKNGLSKHDMDNFIIEFKSCTEHIIDLVIDVCKVDTDPHNKLRDLLENVSTLVDYGMEPFMPCIQKLFSTSVQIATHRALETRCRRMAVEIVAQLCDTKCKELQPLLGSVVPVLLEFVCTEDDDLEEWLDIDENEEGVEADSDHAIGWQTLDRVARGLGGEELLAILFNEMYLPSMLQNQDWKQRRGALTVIYAVAEGCQEQMEGKLREITMMVVRHVEDQDVRVRRAALQAAGQLAVDFAGVLQNTHHDIVMQALMFTIQTETCERVIISALTAVTLFFKPPHKPETEGNILDLYTDPVMKAMCLLLKSGVGRSPEPCPINGKQDARLREQVIQTISVIADLAKTTFETYFDELMPVAVHLLMQLQQDPRAQDFFQKQALQRFRGKTFECITMMGEAVGSAKFEPHREEVLTLLQHYTPADLNPQDDQHAAYILMAWFRVCSIIGGKAFFAGGFMHRVIGPLIEAAAITPDIKTVSDEMENQEGYEYIPLPRKNFRLAVQTSVLQDKEQACKVLMMYAQSLKEDFFQWVPTVTEKMLANVGYTLDPNVSIAACYNLPELLKACNKNPAEKKQWWDRIFQRLMDSLSNFDMKQMEDVESEEYCQALQATMWILFVCLEEMKDQGLVDHQGQLDHEKMQSLDDMILMHIKMYEKRASVRRTRTMAAKQDSELARELEELEERDNVLLQYLSYVITAMFTCAKEHMAPFFEKRQDLFRKWINPKQREYERYFAITGFGELVRAIGERSLNEDYYQAFVMPIINGITDNSSDVRFISCYYVGIFAENGGAAYQEVTLKLGLPKLEETIVAHAAARAAEEANGGLSEDNDYRLAGDAAVSALMRICKIDKLPEEISQRLVGLMILGCPLEPETDEAGDIYRFLGKLVQQNKITNEDYLRKLLGTFYVALTSEMPEEEEEGKVKFEIWGAVQALHSRFPQNVILQTIQEMKLDSRQRLQLTQIDESQGNCLLEE